MYRISIWLKGGGKIVEECDISENDAERILSDFEYYMKNDSKYAKKILRNPLDELPIIVKCDEVAGIQIDKNKKKEYRGRRLETSTS
jgi:hypothetical protein